MRAGLGLRVEHARESARSGESGRRPAREALEKALKLDSTFELAWLHMATFISGIRTMRRASRI